MNSDATSKLEANIWKFYLLEVLSGFSFFYNEIVVLYYRHFGLTFFEISVIMITALSTTVVLEIPTGAFADLYGRRISIFLSGLFVFAGLTLIAFSSTLPFFVVASFCVGLSFAFLSGARNALIYDTLKELSREKEYLRIKSRSETIFLAIGIVSAYFGPYFFSYNVRFPYCVSAAAALLLTIGVLLLYEPEVAHVKVTLKGHYLTMKEGLLFTVRHRRVLWLMLFGVVGALLWRVFGEVMYAPYVIEIGFTVRQFGIIAVIAAGIQTVFTFFVDKIESVAGERNSFVLYVFLESLMLLSIYYCRNYLIALFLGVFWSFSTFNELIIENYINRHLHRRNRATVLSVHSMGIAVSGIVFLPVFGVIIDGTSLSFTILLLIAIAVIGGSLLLFVGYCKELQERLGRAIF